MDMLVLLGSFIPLVGTDLANTWGLGIYIGEALIIDVFTALMLLPLLVYWQAFGEAVALCQPL